MTQEKKKNKKKDAVLDKTPASVLKRAQLEASQKAETIVQLPKGLAGAGIMNCARGAALPAFRGKVHGEIIERMFSFPRPFPEIVILATGRRVKGCSFPWDSDIYRAASV